MSPRASSSSASPIGTTSPGSSSTNRRQSLYRIHILNASFYSAIILITGGSQKILAEMYALGLVASFTINMGSLLIYRYFTGTKEIRAYHTSRVGNPASLLAPPELLPVSGANQAVRDCPVVGGGGVLPDRGVQSREGTRPGDHRIRRRPTLRCKWCSLSRSLRKKTCMYTSSGRWRGPSPRGPALPS